MTLRELAWMAESKRRHDWDQTAEVLAMLFNGLLHPREPLPASAFHPMAEATPSEPVIPADIAALKVFVSSSP